MKRFPRSANELQTMNKEAAPESLAIRNELLLLQAKHISFIKRQRIASLIKMILLTKNLHYLAFQESVYTTLTAIGVCGLKGPDSLSHVTINVLYSQCSIIESFLHLQQSQLSVFQPRRLQDETLLQYIGS